MERVKVFISYSHKDEIWKDRLLTHLSVLDYEGLLHVWTDRRIEVGAAYSKDTFGADFLERCQLQLEVLIFGGNTRVTNQHG